MPQTASTGVESETPDLEAVAAANLAYYDALSARDLAAMERIWALSERDVNVAPPTRPVAHTGWEAIRNNYQVYWATLDALTVSMADPRITVHGSVAWVIGTERAERKTIGGQVSGGPNFGTSIFIKVGDRWLMVFHQTAPIPSPG